jgi:hypothetical protein
MWCFTPDFFGGDSIERHWQGKRNESEKADADDMQVKLAGFFCLTGRSGNRRRPLPRPDARIRRLVTFRDGEAANGRGARPAPI